MLTTEEPPHIVLIMKDHFPIGRRAGKRDEDYVRPRRDARDLDDLPISESMHQKGLGWREGGGSRYKAINNLLASRVGTDWDTVYSEISSLRDQEVKDHVKRWMVKIDTFIDRDGDVAYIPQWHFTKDNERKVNDDSDSLYVHPKTGLLCCTPKTVSRKPYRNPRLDDPAETMQVQIGNDHYIRFQGIWFRAEMDGRHPPRLHGGGSYGMFNPSLHFIFSYRHQPDLRLTRTTQLDGKSLKRLGLVNTPIPKVPPHVVAQTRAARLRAAFGP